jgi:phosphoglucosamine mutase
VIDEMLRNGCNFGGEQSGHLIFGDFSTTGDGLVAALQILHIMKAKQKPLAELARCWTRFPQVISNIRVREKRELAEIDGLTALVAQAEKELEAGGGRILLRYSGTEPKARLLIEGPNPSVLDKWNKQICEVLRKHVGA